MDPASLIALLRIAIPGALQVISIIRDKQSGKTTVMLLDDAIATANDTKDMITAWNTSHPVAGAAAPVVGGK